MFDAKIYAERRKKLKELVKSGLIFFLGNGEAPMNYPSNTYKFRQDSSFLYYFGLDEWGVSGVIDVDADIDYIVGSDRSIDDVVWMGATQPIMEKAASVGIEKIIDPEDFDEFMIKTLLNGKRIHYLPQYRGENMIRIEKLLGYNAGAVNNHASLELTKAVISMRSIKSEEEIAEIEKAVGISYDMNLYAMKHSAPGKVEREIYGGVEGIALSKGEGVSFPIIFSVRGETLHNHLHDNIMKDGDIAILDSGAESLLHYASDITRTFPVSGKFTAKQKDIYNIVLNSQLNAIQKIKPGAKYKEIHLHAAEIIADGLISLGLMKGDPKVAVEAGAHALFFPHGLGHMMGLDVHDMEGLGENLVGYDEETARSQQFGLAYLRLAKELNTGFVLTVEPGIYFIPQLIKNWKSENKHSDFIDYDKVEEYLDFGGIRIEDDILVTKEGHRILGKSIPKTVAEVEEACGG